MGQEAEAVDTVDHQHTQPKVERHACERGKIDAHARIGALVLPGEEGRKEGHKEDETIREK